jgi:hypothetical protein
MRRKKYMDIETWKATLVAWLGGLKSFGERVDEADFFFVLEWLRERTPHYL